MQFTLNSFTQLFPDKIFFPDNSLIFSKIPDIYLTAVKFPDISRFSRQVVTLRPVPCLQASQAKSEHSKHKLQLSKKQKKLQLRWTDSDCCCAIVRCVHKKIAFYFHTLLLVILTNINNNFSQYSRQNANSTRLKVICLFVKYS